MLDKFKNLLIVGLIFLSIGQTVELWTTGLASSDINFSINIRTDKKNKKNTNSLELYFSPKNITIKDENLFYIQYSDKNEKHLKAIKKILSNKKTNFEWNDKLREDNQYVTLEYAIELNREILDELSTEKFSKNLVFNKIRITEEKNEIFLELYGVDDIYIGTTQNKEAIEAYKYLFKNKELLKPYKKIDENKFVLDIKSDKLEYESVQAVNPYLTNRGIIKSYLESNIEHFFKDKRMNILSTIEGEVIIFSTPYTVVKYFDKGLLEYSYYNQGYDNKILNEMENLEVVKRFLEEDLNNSNEYYVEKYELLEEGSNRVKINLGYSKNNMPIFLTETQKKDYDIDSFIEIIMENGEVINYKKLSYNIVNTYNFMEYKKNKISSLLEEELESSTLNIEIGYDFLKKKDMTLYFKIEKENENYLRSAKFERIKN